MKLIDIKNYSIEGFTNKKDMNEYLEYCKKFGIPYFNTWKGSSRKWYGVKNGQKTKASSSSWGVRVTFVEFKAFCNKNLMEIGLYYRVDAGDFWMIGNFSSLNLSDSDYSLRGLARPFINKQGSYSSISTWAFNNEQRSFKLATAEEIKWLQACESKGKFITKEKFDMKNRPKYPLYAKLGTDYYGFKAGDLMKQKELHSNYYIVPGRTSTSSCSPYVSFTANALEPITKEEYDNRHKAVKSTSKTNFPLYAKSKIDSFGFKEGDIMKQDSVEESHYRVPGRISQSCHSPCVSFSSSDLELATKEEYDAIHYPKLPPELEELESPPDKLISGKVYKIYNGSSHTWLVRNTKSDRDNFYGTGWLRLESGKMDFGGKNYHSQNIYTTCFLATIEELAWFERCEAADHAVDRPVSSSVFIDEEPAVKVDDEGGFVRGNWYRSRTMSDTLCYYHGIIGGYPCFEHAKGCSVGADLKLDVISKGNDKYWSYDDLEKDFIPVPVILELEMESIETKLVKPKSIEIEPVEEVLTKLKPIETTLMNEIFNMNTWYTKDGQHPFFYIPLDKDFGIGLGSMGMWTKGLCLTSKTDYRQAASDEIEDMLTAEAKRRGVAAGCELKCLRGWDKTGSYKAADITFSLSGNNTLWVNGLHSYALCVYQDGKWAKITPTPSVTNSGHVFLDEMFLEETDEVKLPFERVRIYKSKY